MRDQAPGKHLGERAPDPLDALAAARTHGEALARAMTVLRDAEEPSPATPAATPTLDAQVLLAHVTGVARALLLAYPERMLAVEQAERFAALVARRYAGEPVAYLTGHREFLGLDLLADARALIPRPETEVLVEAALAALRERLAARLNSASGTPSDSPRPAASPFPVREERHGGRSVGGEASAAPLPAGRGAGGEDPGSPHPLGERWDQERFVAADIGTGSGAIALAMAALEPRLDPIYALDRSAEALALARENAARLGLRDRIRFLEGDLLSPLPRPVDLLLANLPYVAPADAGVLPRDVREYEPALALYGGADGLALLRRFFATAPAYVAPGAVIGVEFGYNQRSVVETLARAAFPGGEIRVGVDYAGWERFALVWAPAARQ
jgi:release factor glutamine methyltransferase